MRKIHATLAQMVDYLIRVAITMSNDWVQNMH